MHYDHNEQCQQVAYRGKLPDQFSQVHGTLPMGLKSGGWSDDQPPLSNTFFALNGYYAAQTEHFLYIVDEPMNRPVLCKLLKYK